jgi:hypothetical protein
MTAPTLVERIEAALRAAPDQRMRYYDLARVLWPARSLAWQHATKGGPPGCYMALSAGIRRGEFGMRFFDDRGQRVHGSGRIITLGARAGRS